MTPEHLTNSYNYLYNGFDERSSAALEEKVCKRLSGVVPSLGGRGSAVESHFAQLSPLKDGELHGA